MLKRINIILNKIKNSEFWTSLVKNSFFAFIGDSVSSFINLIITIILIKLIGDYGNGLLILSQSYMQIMDVVFNIQSWKGVILYGQKALIKNKIQKFYGYIKLGCILDISTAISGGIISIAFSILIGKIFGWSKEIILCTQIFSFTIFSHFSGTPTAILRILNKFNLVAVQKILSALIKLISLFVVWKINAHISLLTAVIIYSVTDIIGNIILIIFALFVFIKNYSFLKLVKSKIPSDYKEFIKFTIWGTLSDIVDIPINYFDVFIVSFLSVNLVSVYKVFKQFVSILTKFTTAIHQAILPQFSELTAKGLKANGYKAMIKIRNLTLIVFGIISLILGLSSPIWLKVFYGEIYSSNWYILLIYLLLQTIMLSYSTLHPYFTSLGKTKESTEYVLISNIIYMVLSVLLIKKFGLLILIICNFIQGTIVIILKLRYIKKYELNHKK